MPTNRVRDTRASRLLTQEKLAKEAGVTLKTVNLIERGLRTPNVITQEKLARALGVPRLELFPEPEEVSA